MHAEEALQICKEIRAQFLQGSEIHIPSPRTIKSGQINEQFHGVCLWEDKGEDN